MSLKYSLVEGGARGEDVDISAISTQLYASHKEVLYQTLHEHSYRC